MTPILYEKDEIDFTSQGLGSLVEIYDVDVQEQRNGLLQLTASYPVSGVRYADISVGRIILAKPNQRDDVHAFRIVSTELDISGYAVTIEADSITYDLTHNIVKHLNVSGNGQSFMTAIKNAVVNPSIFEFYSDIATSSTTSLNYVNPMEAIMGTTGSFLQIWGGELKRENRRVAMFNRRGRDNVSTFRLGKNISGLKYSVDISSLVTRIIPTKSVQNDDQTTTTLEGTPVDSQYINNYEQIYTLPLEFTDDTIKTVADLNAAAKGWFTQSANIGRDKPTITIDIDVLSLQDSADYQDKFKNLESVSLTDTVTVYVPEYGVNVTAIVNELHYDPILDRVTKMTVGTAKQSFADSSRNQLSDLQDKIISVKNQADAAAVSANGKNKNYWGSVEPSHPQEGDLWYWIDGDKSGIKQFINGDWVGLVDSDTQAKIAAGVTDAVTQANAHTDSVKQGLSTDINTAKSQAASQASAAETNAKSAATYQFTQAQNALSAAKTDLTNSIASEASARNQAVAAANSQAQTYANQAKADALNTIAKEVTDRQNAVSALDTKATNAVNQAKSDINDTINAISVGSRNLLIGTSSDLKTKQVTGDYNVGPQATNGNLKIKVVSGQQYTYRAWLDNTNGQRNAFVNVRFSSDLSQSSVNLGNGTSISNGETGYSSLTFTPWGDGYIWLTPFGYGTVQTFLAAWKKEKLENGNVPTDWTPAPEDVVLDYTTKDNQIKETITQYQTTNDGKVTKAQTDATTALGLVATKVSQTDYDQKTGDLTTKYTTVKQTVDSQASDIVDIKKTASSQASKINSISSDVDGTKQSISDIETTQDSQSEKINQISTDVDGTKQSITDIQTKNGDQDTRMGNIETSVSGVKTDFSTYKTTNDGAVKTAQTTAQTAVDGLKTKVSQTDYNTKTGQLQTDLTATTQTANQAKTDIASIKQTDTSQDARMTQIESDASGVKTTVSDLKTTQGKQSGDISTLQQRADGFDATVTKVNNLSVGGGVNLLQGTGTASGDVSYGGGTFVKGIFNGYDAVKTNTAWQERFINLNSALGRTNAKAGDWFTISVYVKADKQIDTGGLNVYRALGNSDANANDGSLDHISMQDKPIGTQWQQYAWSFQINNISLQRQSTRVEYSNDTSDNWIYWAGWVLEKGIVAHDWSPAPEDIDSATAKAQLTADNASLTINNYKQDADGRITKAQSDITATAKQVATKVSQSDYDAETSELTNSVSKAQQTADAVTTSLGNYKQDADGRISANSADIVTNANAITQKVSQTDYDKETGDLTTAVTKAQTTADGAVTTVGNYQTSNDNRVKAAESAISQNADAIALKVSKTDYDSNNSQLDTRFTKVETTANGTATTVSNLQKTVNNLGQINQLMNTEFSPDFAGWYDRGLYGRLVQSALGNPFNGSNVFMKVDGGPTRLQSVPIAVVPGTKISYSVQKLASSSMISYINNVDVNGNMVNVPGTSSPEFGVKNSIGYTKVENIIIPDGVTYISFGLYLGGFQNGDIFSQPMLVFSDHVGTYVQGNYNNNAALAQVKITADSISNFVRDSSGNISSDFQTAFSKTSIITGSTLATSIQKQTATQITSALTDNNGKIISLINQDTSGVQIVGKNIILDGNTTVTGDFYAKGGNFKNLNASNMTVGTLNGTNVNITNINANNIVSGAISGANLNINLNTGSVVFQKGRINSSDYTTDINIDQGYISTANGDTRVILSQGEIQLVSPNIFSPQTTPYLEISNKSGAFNGLMSGLIKARDSLTVALEGHEDRNYDIPLAGETFIGMNFGMTNSSSNALPMMTKIGGGDQGVILSGGGLYAIGNSAKQYTPNIQVGSNSTASQANGDRIYIKANYVHVPSAYIQTTSASANVVVGLDGSLVRSSSARKYKLDIKNNIPIDDSLKLIDVPLSTWVDKHEHEKSGSNERYFGMIAEDLRDAGLEYLVQYGEDNEVEGINYDRVALLLIPLVKKLKERIEELESKGK